MNCLFGGNTCTWSLLLVIVFLLAQGTGDYGCNGNCGNGNGNGRYARNNGCGCGCNDYEPAYDNGCGCRG